MSTKRKVKRLIGGIAFTIVFLVFAFISCKVAVHSSDLNYTSETTFDHNYGYDRENYLIRMGRSDELSSYVPEGYVSASSAAVTESDPAVSEPAPAAEETEAVPAASAEPEIFSEPAAEPTVDPNSSYGKALANAAALGLPEPPDIDITEWQYLLVNASHPLDPVDYAPTLAYLTNTCVDSEILDYQNGYGCAVDERIAQALVDFSQACKAEGLPVYLSSGYRSYDEQMTLFQRKVNQGYTEDVAKTIVAYPGTSEHQTGLSCDITDYYRETKDSSLEQTATYQWLCAHCAEYGFVVRYPADKSGSADSVTGIIYEPWHFRYVGTEAAQYMTDNGLCLEEFVALYE